VDPEASQEIGLHGKKLTMRFKKKLR